MTNNVTLPLGSISLIDKAEKNYGLISGIIGKAGGRSRNFVGTVKLLLCNRMDDAVSMHRILPISSDERFGLLGINDGTAERSIHRTLQKVGREFPIPIERYQEVIKKHGLIDDIQISDFFSSYFEGKNAEFAAHGHSRDHRPDKKQVTWGISTGINGIPSALTIQKGNVQDKTHMREMLSVCTKILDKGLLLLFDCGANTSKVKDTIIDNGPII